MIVVADTSPLNYLIQIDCDSLLPSLYGKVVVPPGVMQELGNSSAPRAIHEWLIDVPPWIEVIAARSSPEVSLAFLDLGEREAIQLAEEKQADLLLIDERKGRQEALRRGLMTTGTLGILLTANELGLIDAGKAFRRLLDETTFRISAALEDQFLRLMKPKSKE